MISLDTAMPRKPKEVSLVTKIHPDVLRLAKIVAAYEDTTIADLISDILRPILEKKLTHHQAEEAKKKPKRGDD